MAVIGVDEHVWRHTRRGDKYVIVIIGLTAVRDKTGSARLVDMVEGRSKKAFADWLAERPKDWRDGVEVVAMAGFSGFTTATTDDCRRRVRLATRGHRGRKADPLYACRRTLHTGADLITDKQKARRHSPPAGRPSCPLDRPEPVVDRRQQARTSGVGSSNTSPTAFAINF